MVTVSLALLRHVPHHLRINNLPCIVGHQGAKHPLATTKDLEIDDTGDLEEAIDSSPLDSDNPYESEESELAADKSLHAKPGSKGGGPRKDGIKSGTVEIDMPVPTPRYRVFKSDSTNPNQSSKSGWNYANTLPEWAKSKIIYYVYRDWPVLLDPGFDEETETYNRQYKYIDKISGNEPIQDDMDLLHRYGCGTYRIVAKDSSSKRKVDKPIFTVLVMNVGGADYKSNPPTDDRINDVDQVDLDHPANKSYVSYLRGQGKLPEQVDGRLKEHEMATVETVKEVTTQQGVLVKEIIGMARERGQTSENASKAQAEVMADTIKTSNEMTREAAKQSIGMVKDAFDQAKAMLPTATTPDPNANPMHMALEIVKLIREDKPQAQGADARYDALQVQLAQLQQSQIDRLSKQVETLLDAKVTGPAASNSPFSAMDQGLDSLEKFNNVMTRLRGDKEEGNDVVDAVADAAPKWLRPILPLIPGLAQGVIGWMQMRQQAPQPTYYQTADGRVLPFSPPQPMPQPQQQIQSGPVPVRPIQQFGPQPVPNPTTNPAQDPIYALLSSITIPLLNNLQVNGTGTDFADWFVGGYGQDVYEDVAQLGPDTLFAAISTFPPIVTNAIYAQTPVDQVQKFVTEFCDPKWPDEGEGEGTEGGIGKGPESGPIPA